MCQVLPLTLSDIFAVNAQSGVRAQDMCGTARQFDQSRDGRPVKFPGEAIKQQRGGQGDLAQQTEGSCHEPEGECLMTPQGAEETTRVCFIYEDKCFLIFAIQIDRDIFN